MPYHLSSLLADKWHREKNTSGHVCQILYILVQVHSDHINLFLNFYFKKNGGNEEKNIFLITSITEKKKKGYPSNKYFRSMYLLVWIPFARYMNRTHQSWSHSCVCFWHSSLSFAGKFGWLPCGIVLENEDSLQNIPFFLLMDLPLPLKPGMETWRVKSVLVNLCYGSTIYM